MREIDITEKCLDFIDMQVGRVSDKFFQLIEIMEEVKIVHTNFVKSMGVKSMRFSTSKNGVISIGMYLTQKQIKKLFNDQTKS